MSLVKKLAYNTLAGSLFLGANNSKAASFYEDFSSGILNPQRFEIRQDPEGQPFTEDYGLISENGNNLFHMQQNTVGDSRTYLVPQHEFTTGDKLQYTYNIVSKSGNYGSMALLTGDQYIRMGISGFNGDVQGFDDLGEYNITFEFQPNNLFLTRQSPSGALLFDNLLLNSQDGQYSLYLGAFSGHNGTIHMDLDNVSLNYQAVPESNSTGLFLGLSSLALGLALRKSKS